MRLGNPSTIQRVTGEGVTYPTHTLVYYRRAANRKAFSNYKIIYKLRSKCVPRRKRKLVTTNGFYIRRTNNSGLAASNRCIYRRKRKFHVVLTLIKYF